MNKEKSFNNNLNVNLKLKNQDITVILNLYKRPEYFDIQLESIKNQSIQPKEIMIWQNEANNFKQKNIDNFILKASSNYNFGVWARFAFALNARTEFVCIFDDDTIPGKFWLENCLETMSKCNGLLGTVGVIHLSGYTYFPMERFGWVNPNEEIKQVDIVGHCWFFRRQWLSCFWRELPPLNFNPIVGEDIHFSAMLQRFANINTYVPPHPINNHSLWGCLPYYGNKFGNDNFAISRGDNDIAINEALNYEIKRGFKLLNS